MSPQNLVESIRLCRLIRRTNDREVRDVQTDQPEVAAERGRDDARVCDPQNVAVLQRVGVVHLV